MQGCLLNVFWDARKLCAFDWDAVFRVEVGMSWQEFRPQSGKQKHIGVLCWTGDQQIAMLF